MPETNPQPCVCEHKLVQHRHFGQCEARIIYSQCPCGYYRPQQPIEPTGGVAPSPAGWPSDEAVAKAIAAAGIKIDAEAENSGKWSVYGGFWNETFSDTERGRYLVMAAAVQRLYAPLRERLARLEGLAHQMVDGDTIGPVEYHTKYPDVAPSTMASDWLEYYVAKARAALQGGSHDAT